MKSGRIFRRCAAAGDRAGSKAEEPVRMYKTGGSSGPGRRATAHEEPGGSGVKKIKSMHMKRLLYLGAICLGCSCSYHFEIDEVQQPSKLVLYAFPGDCDTTFIQLSKSVPVSHTGKRQTWVAEADIAFRVNGEERKVERLGADDPFTEAGDYFVTGKFAPGDRVEVSASAAGLAPVTSFTQVPDTFPLKQIRAVKKNRTDGTGPTLQFQITLADDASTAGYYGVKIERMEESWYKNEPFDEFYSCRIYSASIEPGDEPLLNKAGALDDLFFVYDPHFSGLYVFSDEKINGREYTLHLSLTYFPQNYDSGDGYYRDCFYYRLSLFSLSREYYLYIENQIARQNNQLGESGLSPVRPTYTNVRDGLGVVGGYRLYQTGWLDYQDAATL